MNKEQSIQRSKDRKNKQIKHNFYNTGRPTTKPKKAKVIYN